MTESRNPIAVVTGGSSGIGRSIVQALAASQYTVAIGYRSNADGAEQVRKDAENLGAQAVTFAIDLSDPAAAAESLNQVIGELGGIDVLVNNAGVNRRGLVLEETLHDWQRIMDIDLTAPFACTQAAARHMVSAGVGGRIVNITSVHDTIPISGGAAYCAAKGGLALLTRVAALELAEHGITVNAVAPGETATPMNGVAETTDAADISRPQIPLNRPGRPSEVADLVRTLVGPGGAYTTGVTITVDGGLSLMAAIPNQAYANES